MNAHILVGEMVELRSCVIRISPNVTPTVFALL
jgi:hypothetical protein